MSIIDDLTGKTQAEASVNAAKIQAQAAGQSAQEQRLSTQEQIAAQKEALATLRSDLDPFKQFGAGMIDQATQAATGAQDLFGAGAPDAIMNNPMFQALLNQSQTNILQNQAVRGRLGTGETPQFLQDAALRTGFDVLNQERSAQLQNAGFLANLVGMGQNAAAQQGTGALQTGANIANTQQAGTANVNDLRTSAAAANAAGIVGAANAKAAGLQNIISTGVSLIPGIG